MHNTYLSYPPPSLPTQTAAVNDAPTLPAAPLALSTVEDTPLDIANSLLLANATDVETPAASLVITITAQPSAAAGTLSTKAQGFRFTPVLNSNAPASFTYRVSDGSLNSNERTVNIAISERCVSCACVDAQLKRSRSGKSQPHAWGM